MSNASDHKLRVRACVGLRVCDNLVLTFRTFARAHIITYDRNDRAVSMSI